jgi:hypothetical protein
MAAWNFLGNRSVRFSFLFLLLSGCAGLNDGLYNDGYNNNNNRYENDRYYGSQYEYDRRRDALRREQDDLYEQRRRLEEERQRLEAERAKPPPPIYRPLPSRPSNDRCPPGFQPSERRCSNKERKRGCKDMRLPSGMGCVRR